jgi:hypothetical protein
MSLRDSRNVYEAIGIGYPQTYKRLSDTGSIPMFIRDSRKRLRALA